MNLSEENLKLMGYKEFHNSFEQSKSKDYKCSYQKTISDDLGKKFFITIHTFWDTYNYNNNLPLFTTDVQFKRNNKDNVEEIFNIYYFTNANPSSPVTKIEDLEDFYSTLWETMNCNYYTYWN